MRNDPEIHEIEITPRTVSKFDLQAGEYRTFQTRKIFLRLFDSPSDAMKPFLDRIAADLWIGVSLEVPRA